MSDDINKKIIIDVEINNDGQQQIDQYKTSFDSLKTTLNDIKKPLQDLSGNIEALNKGISDIGNAAGGTKNKIADVTSSFSMWNGTVKVLRDTFDLMTASISAGLSILITFAPEIIKWISFLIKGKEAVTQATLSLGVLNKALQSTDYSNAIQQVSQLKTNIDLAKKGFLDKKTVLEQYNKTLGQTMGTTNDLNKAEKILLEKGDAYIKLTLLKAEAQLAFQNAAQKAVEAEQEKHKSVEDELSLWDEVKAAFSNGDFLDPIGNMGDIAATAVKKADQNRKDAINDLNKQKDTYTKIAADFEVQAAKISKAFHLVDPDNNNGGQITPRPKAPQNKPVRQAAPAGGFPAPKQDLSEEQEVEKELDAEQQLLDTQTRQKEVLQSRLEMQTAIVENDEKALENAKGLTAKYDAQKQLISDTATLEITKANGNAEIIKQIKDQQNKDLKKLDDNYQEQKAAQAKQKAGQIKDFEIQMAQQATATAFSLLTTSIKQQSDAKLAALQKDQTAELNNGSLTSAQKVAIQQKYQQQENQVKAKAFKDDQEASIAQAIINGALAITKSTAQTGVLAELYIPTIIAETAVEVAKIASQKPPAYASGGLHYTSDGRGGLLSGYSRADNTNAFLRSGEGIVVSEAMREPWARNLVSAINVGFGGRDFSTATAGRGFAVGGIFTDGGNANRYYNQPVNDNKNLANTIAYQMINNFPPVYVDVKDINNQQNILAQTINRVNL